MYIRSVACVQWAASPRESPTTSSPPSKTPSSFMLITLNCIDCSKREKEKKCLRIIYFITTTTTTTTPDRNIRVLSWFRVYNILKTKIRRNDRSHIVMILHTYQYVYRLFYEFYFFFFIHTLPSGFTSLKGNRVVHNNIKCILHVRFNHARPYRLYTLCTHSSKKTGTQNQ